MAFTRLFVFLIICYFFQINSNAQEISYGLKGGVTAGTPYSKPKPGASGTLGKGPVLGVFLEDKFSRLLTIHLELYYSYKTASFNTPISGDTLYAEVILGKTYYIPTLYSGRAKGKFENNYMNMPAFLEYKVSKRFNFIAGPQVSFLLSGYNAGTADVNIGSDPNYPYTTIKDKPFDQSSKLSKWDIGAAFGTIFEATRRLFFNLNFSAGLKSIYKKGYKNPNGTVRNLYMQFSLDFKLGKANNDIGSENK
jgi:Outer membrane protein beta-barrel domain